MFQQEFFADVLDTKKAAGPKLRGRGQSQGEFTFREAQAEPTGEPHAPQPERFTGSLCAQLPDLRSQARATSKRLQGWQHRVSGFLPPGPLDSQGRGSLQPPGVGDQGDGFLSG